MLVFLGFLMFAFVKAAYHPSKMCIIEKQFINQGELKEVEDCSFQFLGAKERICNVFTRNVCVEKTVELRNSIVDHETQSRAKFSVEVLPYTAVVNISVEDRGRILITQSPSLSAINISFTILDKDVNGIAFFIRDDTANVTFCRYLDFKDYPNGTISPIHLFYDCLYFGQVIQNVTMTFISLPMKESLSYFGFIPSQFRHSSLCKWQALIMVFQKALAMGLVQIKFSTVPQHFNVSSYTVELTNAYSGEKIYGLAQPEGEMGYVEFTSVEEGFYYVSVKPFDLKESSTCSFPNTQTFYVAAPYNIGRALVLLLSSFFLLVLCLILVLKCCHLYHNQELPYKQAFFVYSEDSPVHKAFICSFADYLTYVHNINVSTIYGEVSDPDKWIRADPCCENKLDPKEWIKNKFRDSDIIVYIISEGLHITLEENEYVVKEISPWRNQRSDAVNYISFQIFQWPNALEKRYCIVYFPYSNENKIPNRLSDIGKRYRLPVEMKSFLRFSYGSLVPFTNLLHKLAKHKPDSSDRGKEFLEKMKMVEKAVENGAGIEKHKKPVMVERKSDVHLHSVLNKDNYSSVESEDLERDSESAKDNRETPLKQFEYHLKRVYNDSCRENCENEFTPFLVEAFKDENM